MPPRDPNLPEGTDSIIDGSSDLGGTSSGMASGSSFMDDDDIDDSASASGLGTAAGSFSSDANAGFSGSSTGSVSDGSTINPGAAAQSLSDQASGKMRDVAMQGKDKATDALDSVSRLVSETADTVSERLGPQYGDYVRRAAGALDGFNDSIRGKEVDELFDDARNLVRKSPTVAIGAAAAIGFLLVRLVKSGMPSDGARSSSDSFGADSTRRLASPPRVDNSFDPVA